MGYLANVSSYLWDAGSWLHEQADWLETWIGSWSDVIHSAGTAVRWASVYANQADVWVEDIQADAWQAISDAANALSKALDLEDWRSSITDLLNWAQNLYSNFWNWVRDQIPDVFDALEDIYLNFTSWARSALSDIIETVQDIDLNFGWKIWDYARNWFNRIDDVWENFGTYVTDALGTDWTDTVTFIRNFPSSVTDPIHDLFGDWVEEKKEQIYGFVTGKIEDLWGKIQTKIDEKVEEQAEWWFGLAEKIIEHV